MLKPTAGRAAATALTAALLAAGFIACTDSTSSLGSLLAPTEANHSIVDVANGGALGFNFVSPIVSPTPSNFPAAFDNARTPVVEICKWVSNACSGPLVATISGAAITQSLPTALPTPYYIAPWSLAGVPAGVLYRIRVLENGMELGYADARKLLVGESASKQAAQKIVVLSGSSLSIRFRIAVRIPTQISIAAGDAQSVTVGSTLPIAPRVLVRDVYNNPVRNTSVTFAVASGGGSITGPTVMTDMNGMATVGSWTLGTTAGANTLTASTAASGVTGSPLTITATGVAGAATQMAMHAGDLQTANAGAPVATAPSVVVRDAFNNLVTGATITFAAASGGGSVTGGSATTDANGIATVGSWTLGAAAGPNTLTASALGLSGSPVTFSATGSVGAAAQIVRNAGNAQTATVGTSLPVAPSVMVQDAQGNPVEGVSVSFAVTGGGGSRTGAVATTDANGIASVGSWTLGTTAGTNTLTATATGLTGSPLAFTATGSPGPAVNLQIITQVGLAASGVAFSSQPAVRVRDTYGNLAPSVTVSVTVASGTGTLGGTLSALTDASGIATFSGLSLTGSGNHQLRFSASGAQNALSDLIQLQLAFASLTNGGYHTCGLNPAGAAYCWGYNSHGELGDNSTSNRYTPTLVSGGLTFTSLSAGQYHTCGVTASGAAYCWGYNGYGQLGNNGTAIRTTPTLVSGGISFATISAGFEFTCGRTSAGATYCWGSNSNGQLGDNSVTTRLTPTLVNGGLSFASITTGGYHACGRTSAGVAYCWGYSGNGELGNNGTTQQLTPSPVSGGHSFASVVAGLYHTCANTSAGVAYCWGYNVSGQLGTGSTAPRTIPTSVFGGISFVSLTVGFYHTCGLTSAGVAYCWGRNSDGPLGNNSSSDRTTPTLVSGGLTFAHLVTGGYHTTGLTATNASYAWGYGAYGQLGYGGSSTQMTPIFIYSP